MLVLLMPKYPTIIPLSASLSTGMVYGSTFSAGTVVTTTCSVIVVGGVSPYNYQWEYVSGDSATVNAPTAASTSFRRLHTSPGYRTGLYRCKVTDAESTVVYTGNVSVETEYAV